MKNLILVTGNKEKLNIAKAALSETGINIINKKINCPEIQSDDTETIAKFSAKYASYKLKSNVIKIDSGLFLEALGGFPGPYSEYVERKLNAEDIIKLLEGKTNRKAFYKEVMAYCEYRKEPITFTTYTKGFISERVDGQEGWNFDKIFILDGDTKTMANYKDEERAAMYSHENWINLVNYLREKSNINMEQQR